MFMSFRERWIYAFVAQRQMFLLVSGRHIAAHSDGHQQFEQFWFLFLMMNSKNQQY